jgi:hypothetical protein
MMAVSIQTQRTTFRAAAPELSFIGPFETGSSHFDISPDGTYFVMVEADPDARPTQIHVVINWMEELKRLASAAVAGGSPGVGSGIDHYDRKSMPAVLPSCAGRIVKTLVSSSMHDHYQEHPRHKQFIAEQQKNWKRARVFDSMVEVVK